MSEEPEFDPYIDLRADARGSDPDNSSPTLRRFHKMLWNKPLPDGASFELEDLKSKGYLRHSSHHGDFLLGSDTISRTFNSHQKMSHILSQLSDDDRERALRQGYTMGGMILFPGVERNGKTLNQVRGFKREIEDRFDLTLESIRRQYAGEANPLSEVLERYWDFFEMFVDFRNYVDFFLLQDLVSDDYSRINFWAPWSDFSTPALPANLEDYLQYRDRMLEWVDKRNQRMARAV